jgi:hypothetical protein
MAADEPKATTQVVTCGKATLIDLEAKDKPVADVLDEIAKKMGYEKIVDPENATPGLKCSCSFKKKPAWECLVEICEKNGLVFGGAGIGQDFALGIYKPGTWKRSVKPSGGLAAIFSQAPAGTPFDDPFHRPYSARVLHEPGIAVSYKDVSVVDQKNAAGKACDLFGLEPTSGDVQEKPGKDNTNPWPGLSAFTIKATAVIVKKKVVANVTGLSKSVASFAVSHEGKNLFTIEKIAEEGGFVVMSISAPSECTTEGVMQGGWGFPAGPKVEAAVGFRVDVVGAKSQPVGPGVISWKGDGAKAAVTFKFAPHKIGEAGGLAALTAKFSKALEKDSENVVFQFKDLAK